jgi:hypothetical protein
MLEAFEAEYVENGASANAYALNPGIVHLVQKDNASGNVLFRGNMPVANGVFQYDQLVKAMRDAAQASGQVLPPTFKVIDISLVNELTGGEKKDLAVEKAYWSTHPAQGQLINNPIYGSLTSPNSYPSSKRKELEKHPSLGHLGDLIDRIHALLTTRSADGIPVLLYVHCEAGKDRTGEVIGAYAMKYMGVSYKDALANAHAVAGRKLGTFNRHGLEWHAYYLADYEGITTIGPIN